LEMVVASSGKHTPMLHADKLHKGREGLVTLGSRNKEVIEDKQSMAIVLQSSLQEISTYN